MQHAAQIVLERQARRPVVVLSAMAGTTDRLLRCAQLAGGGNLAEARGLLSRLRDHHEAEAAKCIDAFGGSSLAKQIAGLFSELGNLLEALSILGENSPQSQDAIASYGERLSTLIFAPLLEQCGIRGCLMDSRLLIRTNSDFTRALPDFTVTKTLLQASVPQVCKSKRIPILQGFIGSDERGVTTTLGRGGSDYSAAIIGSLLDAEEIQIWTDVPGILTADPKIIPGARKIRTISFAEASELAYFGARVLHPSTILPAMEKEIPVYVLDSNHPNGTGTRITAKAQRGRNPIKSIAYKNGIVMVNITSTRMLMAYGFLSTLFRIFEKCQRSVDMVSTSEVSVSLTLDNAEKLDAITQELLQIGAVQVDKNKAIICLVGDNIKFTPGIAGQVFSAIDSLNIHMISQGASANNLSFVVSEENVVETVQKLHDQFFRDPDPEIFE